MMREEIELIFNGMMAIIYVYDSFPVPKHSTFRFESDFATTGKSYGLSHSMVAYSDSGIKKNIPLKNLKHIRERS
jgi:hypothetical protein